MDAAPLMPNVCGDCRFDIGGTDENTALGEIGSARLQFEAVLDDLVRSGGPQAIYWRPNGSWTPIEHVVHVTESIDASRRVLFRLRGDAPLASSLVVELLRESDGTVPQETALRQLDDATVWLLRALATVPANRRAASDVQRSLARAAHEIVHHRRMVAALVLTPTPATAGATVIA